MIFRARRMRFRNIQLQNLNSRDTKSLFQAVSYRTSTASSSRLVFTAFYREKGGVDLLWRVASSGVEYRAEAPRFLGRICSLRRSRRLRVGRPRIAGRR